MSSGKVLLGALAGLAAGYIYTKKRGQDQNPASIKIQYPMKNQYKETMLNFKGVIQLIK